MSYLPKEEKRKAILDAALSLVVSGGFASITARNVARQMGAATGTIHHHFSSLSELKSEVLRYAVGAAIKADRAAIKNLPPYESLLQLLLPSNYADREYENRVWVSAADEMSRNEALKGVYREAMAELIDEIEGVILQGQAAGIFHPKGNIRQCAWKLTATAFSLASYIDLDDHCLDMQAIDELVTADIQLTLGVQMDIQTGKPFDAQQ